MTDIRVKVQQETIKVVKVYDAVSFTQFATSASFASTASVVKGTIESSSLAVTASYAATASVALNSLNANTGSFTGSLTGSLQGSASYASNAGNANTSTTASYSTVAQTVLDTPTGVPTLTANNTFTGQQTINRSSINNTALQIKGNSDTEMRLVIRADGKLSWGAGGSNIVDTFLQRINGSGLSTDGVLLVSGNFAVGTNSKQTEFFSVFGDSRLTTQTGSSVVLTVSGAATQSADILSLWANGGTVARITSAGLYAGSASYAANAGSANIATSASYATVAQSVLDTPNSASHAVQADTAAIATTASYSTVAQSVLNIPATSSFALKASSGTGSFLGGFTGSLQGSASYASNAGNANSATSSSFANIATTASLSLKSISGTGSFLGGFTGSLQGTSSYATNALSASFATTASVALNSLNVNTGSFTGSLTGSLLGSASYAANAGSANSATSASFATVSNNVLNPPAGVALLASNQNNFTGQQSFSRPSVGSNAILISTNSDTNSRLIISAAGRLSWGDGSGGADTLLQRTGIGILRTDGNFISSGGLAVGINTVQTEFFSVFGDSRLTVHTGSKNVLTLSGSATQSADILSIWANGGTIARITSAGLYAGSASYAANAGSSNTSTSSSFATNALTASFALNASGTTNSGSFTGSFTGSLFGSASYAINAGGSNTATTASYALVAESAAGTIESASFALNAAVAFRGTGSWTGSVTGALQGSSSYALNAGNANTATTSTTASFALKASSGTGSFSGGFTGSLQGSASYALIAGTANIATSASFANNALTANTATSATFATNTLKAFSGTGSFLGGFTGSLEGSASFASTTVSASFANHTLTANRATTASNADTASVAPQYLPLAGGSVAGPLTASSLVVTGHASNTLFDNGDVSGITSITWTNGNVQLARLVGETTMSFTGAVIGATYTLITRQDDTGGRALQLVGYSFGDNAPTYNTAANKYNVVTSTFVSSSFLAVLAIKGG